MMNEAIFHKLYSLVWRSPDPSTKNAAVVISPKGIPLGWGVNRIVPNSATTPERLTKPLKYSWITHAETDAIYYAATEGVSLAGATMYCCWAACTECAKAIVGVGIKKLVRHVHEHQKTQGAWPESVLIGDQILQAGGVEIENFEQFLDRSVLFGGKEIRV